MSLMMLTGSEGGPADKLVKALRFDTKVSLIGCIATGKGTHVVFSPLLKLPRIDMWML